MYTPSIHLSPVEFIILTLVTLIFALAISFYIKSRKTLKETLDATKKANTPYASFLSKSSVVPAKPAASKKPAVENIPFAPVRKPVASSSEDDTMVKDLKQTLAQQQQLLDKYLDNIEEIESHGKNELRKENNRLQEEIVKLHELIATRDKEVEELYQEARTAQKMASRIEEVYQEFEQLQEKMQTLERQAGKANALAIELEYT